MCVWLIVAGLTALAIMGGLYTALWTLVRGGDAAPPPAAAYHLLALARYQSADVAGALEPAQRAVDMAPDPETSWLSLLLALRLDREEYTLAEPLALRLVRAEPARREHWIELAGIHLRQGERKRAARGCSRSRTICASSPRCSRGRHPASRRPRARRGDRRERDRCG
jgi:hypothetical protein